MELHNGIAAVDPKARKTWRKWLQKNHDKETRIWLVLHRMASTTRTLRYAEAVEEALCFGWVDSTANKRDDETYYITMAKRKPKSNWSRLNRERAENMIALGLMTPAGQAMIDLAKESGTWIAIEDAQNAVIPADLQKLFNRNKTAAKNFEAFSASSKRVILEWIINAKRPETREKRVKETVALAAKGIKANHYRQ